jgi:methionine-S-sulfoxide reductase
VWYKGTVKAMKTLLMSAFVFIIHGAHAQVLPANARNTNTSPRMDAKTATANPATTNAANPAAKQEIATLAGGCFWGMEEIIRKIPGVLGTKVGYTGGNVPNPTYRLITTGITGHAEAVQITYDPAKISFEDVLGYFFRMHDPTTLNQQHNDRGTQYRSAIFYHSDAQKQAAERVKERVNKAGKWPKPIVTEITKASEFWPAEDYHQKYLIKNPNGYNCHFLRD